MNSSEYTPTTLTMTGKSVDEIRNRLWQEYGNNYRIIDQQTVLQGGFLGFFQKSCIKVSFVVKDRGHSEQEDFSTAKESIIKNSKVDYSKLVVKQYNELTGMMAQMNSQIEDLKITSVEKKHPSIVKIEKLLEDNEFTHAFINMISSKLKNESEMVSVSGWVMEQFGRVPEAGDSFVFENLTVRVTRVENHRIEEIQVTREESAEPDKEN